jgi:hypothetical protein
MGRPFKRSDDELTGGAPLSHAERELLQRFTASILPPTPDEARAEVASMRGRLTSRQCLASGGGPAASSICYDNWVKWPMDNGQVMIYCSACGAAGEDDENGHVGRRAKLRWVAWGD